ncbi:MAG: sigma 54-interacting transcriptional regulator [Candidatus Aenigmatarchaeota archaeon]
MVYLSIILNGKKILEFTINQQRITIGRAPNCDVVLMDPSVSRVHANIEKTETAYILRDHSTNGTFIKNRRITIHKLTDGDEFHIGPYKIVFHERTKQQEQVYSPDKDPTRILSYLPERKKIRVSKAYLTVRESSGYERTFPIEKFPYTIGSNPSNYLLLNDRNISPFHFVINMEKEGYVLEDIGSSLTGEKRKILLYSGYRIDVGKTSITFYEKEEEEDIPIAELSLSSHGILGRSARMKEVLYLIDRVSKSDIPVLITGETGTGKELVARTIHKLSSRRNNPFMIIDCATISKTLMESELFGHEKGSFTGAHFSKKGIIEESNGGTAFLDEIGELPLELQPKLLRFLETGEYRRVGSNELRRSDVRIISATNRNLFDEVRKGNFRSDLYYRLHVFPIELPPLRERKEDIPILADAFLKEAAHSGRITTKAMAKLLEYPWPGNVRELKNVLLRASILSESADIDEEHIIFSTPGTDPGLSTPSSLEEIEKTAIINTLRKFKGNKKKTAEVLGIAKSTLFEKLKKYNIKEEDYIQ